MNLVAAFIRASWRDGLAVACVFAGVPILSLLVESLK